MTKGAFRSVAALLSILLLTGVPTHAAPIVISDVVQVLSNHQNPPDLRLRSLSLAPGVKGSLQPSVRESAIAGSLDVLDITAGGPIGPTSDSLLAGIAFGSDPQKVDVIAEGDVEGTVCDCGEITVPGGGWPKWPLLFLAAIPFFFIHDCDDCDQIPTTPTPTPTPTPQVPEPASLLLFGSGLAAFGAGLRRRYSRSRLTAQIRATKEKA
jgi:hypothetical protein